MTQAVIGAHTAIPLELVDVGTRRRRRLGVLPGVILSIAVLALIFGFWALGAELGWINTVIFSSPQIIVKTLTDLAVTGELWGHLGVSLSRAGLGLLIGASAGLVLGVLSGLAVVFERIIDPPVQMIRAIPILAVLPLFVVWFGLGELPKWLVIAFAAAPPLYINTFNGIKKVDKKLIETSDVFRLNWWQRVTQVILPAALPSILNGLRISVALSFILLVAAEQLNTKAGLGFLAAQGLLNFRTDIIFSVVVVYAVLGLLADFLLRFLDRVLLPWYSKKAVR